MTANSFDQFRVTGCIRFDADGPGFALPVVENRDDPNSRYVQEIDEQSGLVARFRVLDGDRRGELPIINGPMVRTSYHQIYCFVIDQDAIHVGRLSELTPVLKAFAAENPIQIGVALQIADLVGTADEKRVARKQMRQVIVEKSGKEAARAFYEGSILRSELWDRLVRNAIDTEAARQILLHRVRIDAVINSDGNIELRSRHLNLDPLLKISTAAIENGLVTDLQVLDPDRPSRVKVLDGRVAEFHDRAGIQENAEVRFNSSYPYTQWLADNKDDHNWGLVWEELLSKSDPSRRAALFDLGRQWLEKHGDRNDWPTVWAALFAMNNNSDNDDLTILARRWLETNSSNSAWPNVWQTLFDPSNAAYDRGLTNQAIDWLDNNARHPAWPTVWRLLFDPINTNLRNGLSERGYVWLEENTSQANWEMVWRVLWNERKQGEFPEHRLINATKKWLNLKSEKTMPDAALEILLGESDKAEKPLLRRNLESKSFNRRHMPFPFRPH